MILSTIIIAVLSALAAVFAVMFYQNWGNAKKFEIQTSKLGGELSDLRVEMARLEAKDGGVCTPINCKTVAEFLRKEKTSNVEILEDSNAVIFEANDQRYYIDCRQSPRFLLIGLHQDIEGVKNIHVDIMERAASYVTESIHMVKMAISENDFFGFRIVSADRTIGTLRENFDIYMSIINDAERAFSEKYWEIMSVEHPDECKDAADNNEPEASSMEDLAMKIASSNAENKKIQS